ncbi:MAG: hypothetical protein P1Q69_09025 [Candidatus Thorarchaeota archaeon]|nr:hypothetical protein [Candidatus Thorarchaeota archaeon]
MQTLADPGFLAAWSLLIGMAWLFVRERGIKDRQLCTACVGVCVALLVIWLLGTMVFLWSPTEQFQYGMLFQGLNFLILVPVVLMVIDLILQIQKLRAIQL